MPQLDPRAGLCAACTHARRVDSARGSTFILCARSATDAGFAKYPRLPVVRCAGYQALNAGAPVPLDTDAVYNPGTVEPGE